MRAQAVFLLLVASCGGKSSPTEAAAPRYDSGVAVSVEPNAASEPTPNLDAGQAMSVVGPTQCAARKATYTVTVRHERGTCGAAVDGTRSVTVDDTIPIVYPPTCFGSCDHSPENCTTVITVACPSDEGLVITSETVSWSLDGATGNGTETVTIQLSDGTENCAAYYAVSYERIGG